jgi:hypothetical protein
LIPTKRHTNLDPPGNYQLNQRQDFIHQVQLADEL